MILPSSHIMSNVLSVFDHIFKLIYNNHSLKQSNHIYPYFGIVPVFTQFTSYMLRQLYQEHIVLQGYLKDLGYLNGFKTYKNSINIHNILYLLTIFCFSFEVYCAVNLVTLSAVADAVFELVLAVRLQCA